VKKHAIENCSLQVSRTINHCHSRDTGALDRPKARRMPQKHTTR
jgi:hypothetical protein